MHLSISSIEYALGKRRVTNEELNAQNPEWDMAAITAKTGIETRFSAVGESALDLGFEASSRALVSIDKSAVDCLLAVTSTADVAFPGIACHLQHKLGLGSHIFAFDINLGCSGFTYSYIVLSALAHAGVVRRPLLVCTDTYTKFISQTDRGARPIFSDAAAATLFSQEDGLRLIDYDFGTDGRGAADLTLGCVMRDHQSASPSLHMDGAKVLMFTLSKVPESVRKILARQNLQPQDIDLFVFHQASKVVLDNLQRTLKIPVDRVFRNLEQFGNTVSCTIPICLKQLMDCNRLSRGASVLLCGFGVGLSWATCLLRVE